MRSDLRANRKKHDVFRHEIARILGVSITQIYRIESDRSKPLEDTPCRQVRRIAGVYGIDDWTSVLDPNYRSDSQGRGRRGQGLIGRAVTRSKHTRRQIAQQAGVNERTLRRWCDPMFESDRLTPRTLLRLAKALHVRDWTCLLPVEPRFTVESHPMYSERDHGPYTGAWPEGLMLINNEWREIEDTATIILNALRKGEEPPEECVRTSKAFWMRFHTEGGRPAGPTTRKYTKKPINVRRWRWGPQYNKPMRRF